MLLCGVTIKRALDHDLHIVIHAVIRRDRRDSHRRMNNVPTFFFRMKESVCRGIRRGGDKVQNTAVFKEAL